VRPERFDDLLASPRLPLDINLQADLVRLLTDARMMASPVFEPMLIDAASALGLPIARLDAIQRLPSTMDIRRALKVRKIQSPTRLPGEEIYPTTGWLGRYLAWGENMEVPLAWHFWTGLSLIAGCARRNFYFDAGAFRIWPALYVCLVGQSGGGKSLCLQSCAEPMLRRVNELLLENPPLDPGIDDTINLIPDRLSTAMFLEQCQQSYIVDLEKQHEAEDDDESNGKSNGKGPAKGVKVVYKRRRDSTSVIVQDELMSFIGKDMFDAVNWIGLLLALSNGKDTFVNPTTTRRRVLTDVSVTALFASAPDNLRKLMPPAFHTGGLQGRFVWCYRPDSGRVFSTTPPLDPVERDHLANWLLHLSRLPQIEVTRHPSTDNWWEQYYAKWDEDKEVEPEFRAWHNRVKDKMLQIAMLLAVSNGRFVIELDDLVLAHTVLAEERSHFSELFTMLQDNKDGEANIAVLRALDSSEWISETFLCRKLVHSVGSLQRMNQSLELLLKAKEVQKGEKMVGPKGAQRKVTYWRRAPRSNGGTTP